MSKSVCMAMASLAWLCLMLTACTATSNAGSGPVPPSITDSCPACDPTSAQPIGPSSYTYTVTGNGHDASSVTYTDSDGTIQQEANAGLPWSQTVDAGGDFYDVSAQDDDGTEISCTITDDQGNVVNQHTAHGQYAIVECQAP